MMFQRTLGAQAGDFVLRWHESRLPSFRTASLVWFRWSASCCVDTCHVCENLSSVTRFARSSLLRALFERRNRPSPSFLFAQHSLVLVSPFPICLFKLSFAKVTTCLRRDIEVSGLRSSRCDLPSRQCYI